MNERWLKGVTAACRLGFAAGACAGAVIASSLLALNEIRTDVMSVLVLCTLFALLYGGCGAVVGAVIGLVVRLVARGRHPSAWLSVCIIGASVCVTLHAIWRSTSDRSPLSLEVAPIAPGVPPLLLIGIDGLDWKIAERLMAQGELPNLSRMRERGFGAPLATIEPTLSPLIWTSIATGVGPERHGVHGFDVHRVRGVDASFARLVPEVGMWRVFAWLRRIGVAERLPVGTESCRVPRLWDVIGAGGREVLVANWWATWPADDVRGWLVTDRFYYFREPASKDATSIREVGTVHPQDALADLATLRVAPSTLTREDLRRYVDLTDEEIDALGRHAHGGSLIESELRFLISMDETYRRVVTRILEREPPPQFSAVYLRGLDIISHAALRFSDLGGSPAQATVDEVQKYGQAVRRYYRATDAIIGEWIVAAGPEATVLVVSDHGFEPLAHDGAQSGGDWGHDHAPDGVIFGAGGLVRHGGDARGASIYDVAPTALYLAGAPVARDLAGEVLLAIVDPDHLRARPVRFVETFGGRVAPAGGTLGAYDEEQLSRLRAIGYIK